MSFEAEVLRVSSVGRHLRSILSFLPRVPCLYVDFLYHGVFYSAHRGSICMSRCQEQGENRESSVSYVSVVHIYVDIRSSFRDFKGIQALAQASGISKFSFAVDQLK